MENKVKCSVSTCKHHNHNNCLLNKIEIAAIDDDCCNKDNTICKSFKDDAKKHDEMN